jgi:hypothetical protein
MTQHVTIFRSETEGQFRVDPDPVKVWKDDQTIMWGLGPGVAWGPEGPGIVFSETPGVEGYEPWPGTTGATIQLQSGPGLSRPFIVALANHVNNGVEVIKYKYTVNVVDTINGIQLSHEKPFDPDVDNHPEP